MKIVRTKSEMRDALYNHFMYLSEISTTSEPNELEGITKSMLDIYFILFPNDTQQKDSKVQNITVNYGVLESSHFYMTTDEKKYNAFIEKGAIPVFTPELISKANYGLDLKVFIVRIPLDK